MAKKATGDTLPNRKYVTVTWAAATTTAVYTNVDTMMGARDGEGWLISRISVQPIGLLDGWQVVNSGVRFQVATEEHAALLAPDDPSVIGTIDILTNLLTGGGINQLVFPVTWVGPVLVAARKLTCMMDGSDDAAPLQSEGFLFTIWYNWVKLGAKEWLEIAEAKGIA